MKIKLSELRPNPFKKKISNGQLNKEQVDKIKANIKELGFFGSLPVFKKDDKYYLVAGHHRTQALKEVYGKDFEVEVVVSDYNEDQVFRGMVIENITQRTNDFMELNENIVAIESYLNSKPEILLGLRESRQPNDPRAFNRLKGQEFKDKATSSDIGFWIDKKTEEVISHDVITQNLNIYHKLDPELRMGVEKKHDKSAIERADDSLNYTQAVMLSSVEKEDQKPLAKVLKETREQRVREQGKLVVKYKDAPEDVKEQVRNGAIDLADIDLALIQNNLREKQKNRVVIEDISKKIDGFIERLSFSISDSEKGLKEVLKDIVVLSRYTKDMEERHKARVSSKLDNLGKLLDKLSGLINNINEKFDEY